MDDLEAKREESPTSEGNQSINTTSGARKKSLRRKKSSPDRRPPDSHECLASAQRVGDRMEFPMTPEMLLEHHKNSPILDANEEWMVVVLNEYECLVDSLEVIRAIASHSTFFEVNPEDLWREFFEFVEEMPYYDEVINSDVWQEFRDKRYSC